MRKRLLALLLLVVVCAAAWAVLQGVLHHLDLDLTVTGYAAAALAAAAVYWYALDFLFRRRSVYALWGLEERVLWPELRLGRRVVLLATAMISIGCAIVTLTPVDASQPLRAVPPQALPPIAVLNAAFLATHGWMYTAAEKEKSDRATQTLVTIREQLAGEFVRDAFNRMQRLSHFWRTVAKDGDAGPIPLGAMLLRLGDLPPEERPDGLPTTSLADAVDQFFDALDHVAFGVRQGQFDFRSIEMILRQRFLRNAYVFHEYIAEQTRARLVGKSGRCRATSRTWEHYLWLVARLKVLKSDQIEAKKIVLPPK